MKQLRLIGLVPVLVLVAVLAGCGGGGGGSEESEGGQTTVAGVAANDHGSKDVAGQEEAKVELDDDYFEPTVIRGDAGQKVTLELENEGSNEHNFSIDDQNIDEDLEPGDGTKVTVTIPESGMVSFYCSYHKDRGMAGALVASGT